MRTAGQVVAVALAGAFIEVAVRVRVDKGIRRGAQAEFKLFLPPDEARSYWIGRRVHINVAPAKG